MKSKLFFIFFWGFAIALISCASPEKPEPKVNRNALDMDNFAVEQGMPVRSVQKQDFFFKHCEVDSGRPFTNKIEYSCALNLPE